MRVDQISVDDTPAPNLSISERIALTQVGDLSFVGRTSQGPGTRTYGGEVAGQAVIAAGSTVAPDRLIHSAHMHFLLPGDTSVPVRFDVEVERDGGTFSARRVVARQPGRDGSERVIFTMAASFQVPEDGLSHQLPRVEAPSPEDTPTMEEMFADDPENLAWTRVLNDVIDVEARFPELPARAAASRGLKVPPQQRAWLRARRPITPGPLERAAALTFISDLLLLSAALGPHQLTLQGGRLQFATINHTVWFHAPLAVDEWFLYEQESRWAGSGRAISRGEMFDRTGALCATTMQEGLVRLLPVDS